MSSAWKHLLSHVQTGDLNTVVSILERYPSHINSKKDNGETLLHVACNNGRKDIAEYLIQSHGMDIEQTDDQGFTSLHEAARGHQYDTLIYLLNKGGNIHALTYKNKNSVIDRAFYDLKSHQRPMAEQFIRFLIENNIVDKDWQDTNGYTLLHYAVQNNLPESVVFLCENNADLFLQSKQGKIPETIALEKGYYDIRNILALSVDWWGDVSDSSITHKTSIGKTHSLTEVFNFKDRVYRAISKNIQDKTECLTVKSFNDLYNTDLLKTAIDQFNKQGGIVPDMLGKSKLQKGLRRKAP